MSSKEISLLLAIVSIFNSACMQEKKHRKLEKPTHTSALASISTVLDISEDSVVVVRGFDMEFTTDGGKSWIKRRNPFIANKITIDNQQRLWVLINGSRVDEKAEFPTLYQSSDFGKHWSYTEFDAKKFDIQEIVSKPRQKLQVKLLDNSLHVLQGESIQADWKKTKWPKSTININPYAVVDDSKSGAVILLKTLNQKTDTILRLDTVMAINDIINHGNTVYLAGNGFEKAGQVKAYFAMLVKDKKLQVIPITGNTVDLFEGTSGRVWVSNYNNVYLLKDNKLLLFK